MNKEYFKQFRREDGTIDLVRLYHARHSPMYPNDYEAGKHLCILRELDDRHYIKSTQVALIAVTMAYHFKRA